MLTSLIPSDQGIKLIIPNRVVMAVTAVVSKKLIVMYILRKLMYQPAMINNQPPIVRTMTVAKIFQFLTH